MARQYDVNDSRWVEVKIINGYALFMGYLMMCVRGLGLLILTWTTVVLLGGFVSDLGKKDFWCLTGITLVQTSGVFNFLLTEKISDMVHLSWGLLTYAINTFDHALEELSWKRLFLVLAASTIQGAVLVVILCPVSILYVFGIYISAGASLGRLIKQDFENDGDGGANMKAALQVLYSLAVAQGILFGYKKIHAFTAKNGLVRFVHKVLGKKVCELLVEEYIEETIAGCEKDPSFVIGRNFVTYGVDLMKESRSNESFIAGIKVLGSRIESNHACGQRVLAKDLLSRSDDSSSAIILRLLETVGPRSPYSREVKGHVVTILDVIASCIRLEQFPRAIECLCSLVDTAESNEDYTVYSNYRDYDYERLELLEQYQKDYMGFYYENPSLKYILKGILLEKLYQCLPCKWLLRKIEELENEGEREANKREANITWDFERMLIKAVNMIHKLVADEDNRWILRTSVSSTVLHKIARLPIKLIHRESHGQFNWYDDDFQARLQVLEKCWEVTEWLLVALIEFSSPVLLPAAIPVGEGRQMTRRGRRSKEIEEGEEQLLRTMDGSALRSTINHTIKHSTESAVKCILDCLDCGETVKRKAIEFLLHRSLDMSTIVKDSESSKRRLSWVLLLIACSTDGIRKLAGEKLSEIMLGQKHQLPSKESARELLQSIQLAHEDLENAFNGDCEDTSMRRHASIIKDGLWRRGYDTRISELQGSIVDAVPEIVTETSIPFGPITAESQEPMATDLEMGIVSQDIQDGSLDIE